MAAYIFGSVGVFLAVVWYVRGRRRGSSLVKKDVVWLLLGSGPAWVLRSVTREGYMLHDGPAQYPISDCVLATTPAALRSPLYVLAADNAVLVDYEEFSRLKESSVKGALFRPTSDIQKLLNMVAVILVICSAIFTFQSSSAISATLTQQQAEISKVVEIVSKPLVIQK